MKNDQAIQKIINILFPNISEYHKDMLCRCMKNGNFEYIVNFLESEKI